MSNLTKQQIYAASQLFQRRPVVIPGTRAIVDQVAQRRWHADVTDTMRALGVDRSQVNTFCDLAGVAD